MIAVVRGLVGEEVMTEAFARKKIDIPRAPALGLLLENVRPHPPRDAYMYLVQVPYLLVHVYSRCELVHPVPRPPPPPPHQVHFDGYNRRLQHFAVEGIHCPLDWTPYEAEAESFKREHIHRSIIDEELSQLSYPPLPFS